ncbi:MAG: hypothetical protein IJC84_04915 [Clostridia bacterium]|nr:hypothetical protein [Clostridia bacterium]
MEQKNYPPTWDCESLAKPLTWDDINAIPVAHEGMSEDELRDICWDFMHYQLNFAWKPNSPILIRADKDLYQPQHVYAGMPYVSSTFSNLYQLMEEWYDEKTGIMDTLSMGDRAGTILGNQCSADSFWGWARVSNTIIWGGTAYINPPRGARYLGQRLNEVYNAPPFSAPNSLADISTVELCRAVTPEGMYEAYAMVKKADGLVTGTNAHVMMVAGPADIKRDENGKILGTSTITVQHQTTGMRSIGVQENGVFIYLAPGYESCYTFDYLIEKGYLPFTIPELCGEKPVSPVKLEIPELPAKATPGQLLTEMFGSNYVFSDLKLVFRDKEGNLIKKEHYPLNLAKTFRKKEITLEELGADPAAWEALCGKETRVEFYARTSNGEVHTLYKGRLV